MILRFEPLEGRQLLSTAAEPVPPTAPDATVTTTVVSPTSGADQATDGDGAAVTTVSTGNGQTVDPADGDAADDPSPVVLSTTGGNTTTSTTTTGAEATTTPAGKPDLTLDAFGTLHNLDWGQPFRAQGRVRNTGTAPAPAGVKVDVYASTRASYGPGAVFVGTATIEEAIAPGAIGEFDAAMIAPPIPLAGLGSSPSYYFLARVDPDGVVAESSETNNGGGPADQTSVVTITPKLNAKLEGTAFLVSPGTTTWGQDIEIRAQITNVVPGTIAPATRARVVLSPGDQTANGPDAVTIGEIAVPQLAAYPPADLAATIRLPSTPPAALAGSSTFNVSLVPDADYLTSTPLSLFLGHGSGRDSSRLTILPGATPLPSQAKADVTVVRLQPVTDTVTWGQALQVRATVENGGTADTGKLRVRFLLADANRPYLAPLALSDGVLNGLPAGYKQDILQTIPLQGALPAGVDPATIAARVVVQVDPENSVDESSEANNQLISTPVKFTLLTKEGTRTDVTPKPGPVTTPTDTGTPPTTTSPTPTTPATTTRPETRRERRWRLHQAHMAQRAAHRPLKRAISPRLRVNRPGLRLAAGTVRILPAHRGATQA
jgi:hypothetical protein